MNESLEDLRAFGCNVEKAVERCVDDEGLYLSLAKIFAEDENFGKLGEYISVGDKENAFSAAHTIKDVAANLDITPIFDAVCVIVEKLRKGNLDGINTDYEKLMRTLYQYRSIVNKI